MRHLRNLMESRPMFSRVPDQSLLVEEKSEGEHRCACRGADYAFIYLPQGGAVEINPAAFPPARVRAWWYDPRTGDTRDLGLVQRAARIEFTAPWSGPCSDWILVLDNPDRNFPAPGTIPQPQSG